MASNERRVYEMEQKLGVWKMLRGRMKTISRRSRCHLDIVIDQFHVFVDDGGLCP